MSGPRQVNLGERLSGLEAKFDAFERYEHERWHNLANDLQPLVNLPVQLTRDIAKIQGGFDGRIATITKENERSITAAVEKAIAPVNADIADLKVKVAALLEERNRNEGAKSLIATIIKSPALAWLISAAVTAWAILTGKVQV